MSYVDEFPELARLPVCCVRGIEQHAVIAPPPLAGEARQRHQFHGRDADFGEFGQPLPHAGVRTLARKGADMHFVDDSLLPRPSTPVRARPIFLRRHDELRRTVNPLRLKA
jgi:hypothetical protein